jgi:hypothetical protein
MLLMHLSIVVPFWVAANQQFRFILCVFFSNKLSYLMGISATEPLLQAHVV